MNLSLIILNNINLKMEKFVKFEDPTCGINPFLPLEIKEENKLSPLW